MYNETYSCRHHKYTINIPIALYNEAETKSKEAGFEELAPYLRAVISKEVRGGNINIQDILGEKEVKRREYQTKHRREDIKYSFVRLNIKNFLDKVCNGQIYFW